MTGEALVAAIKAGDMVDIVTALCAVSDGCWVFGDPSGDFMISGIQLGSTNVYTNTAGVMEWHSHPDAETAAACLALNRAEALRSGWIDTGLKPELVAAAMPAVMAATGPVPDAVVEVDGRPAVAYYV